MAAEGRAHATSGATRGSQYGGQGIAGRFRSGRGIVPALLERVMPVHEVVYVEHFLPGCPPSAANIKALVLQMLSGVEPKLEGKQIKFG